MPSYTVKVEQYERHVATYEEEVVANTPEDAAAIAIRRVVDGHSEHPDLVYCDTPDDSGSIEIPGVSARRMYTALTLAGVSVDDADGPCVASIRDVHVTLKGGS